ALSEAVVLAMKLFAFLFADGSSAPVDRRMRFVARLMLEQARSRTFPLQAEMASTGVLGVAVRLRRSRATRATLSRHFPHRPAANRAGHRGGSIPQATAKRQSRMG